MSVGFSKFQLFYRNTVAPLIEDAPNIEHNSNYLSTKDTLQATKHGLAYSANPLFTSEEWVISLQWTK